MRIHPDRIFRFALGIFAIALTFGWACASGSVAQPAVPQIDMGRVIVRSSCDCSGVIVRDELVVTAKHCADSVWFENKYGRSPAKLMWSSAMQDGPSFFRVKPGFATASIPILQSAPKPNTFVDLYWVARNGRPLRGQVAGLQTVLVSKNVPTPYKMQSNLVMAQVEPGASGGAAVQNGKLAGVILHGNFVLKETGICLNEELRRGYLTCVAELDSRPTVTLYSGPKCAPCIEASDDIFTYDRYRNIPVRFIKVDIVENRVTDIAFTPTFELFGNRFVCGPDNPYDGNKVAKWISMQLRMKQEAERNDAELTPVPDFVPPPVTLKQRTFPPQQPDPSTVDMSAEDWSNIKVVALASKAFPEIGILLSGPVSREVRSLSEGNLTLEVVHELSEPNRFRAVENVAGIRGLNAPVYFFVLIDSFADVGIVKGLVLKKIEAKVDLALADKLGKTNIEVITRRSEAGLYDSMRRALSVQEPVPVVSETPTKDPVTGEVVDNDDEYRNRGIAGGGAALVIGLLFRIKRFWDSWHHSTVVAQTLDLSPPVKPVAPPTQAAPVKASPPPVSPPPVA